MDPSFRPVRLPDDAARLTEIITAIWHGGADAIMEHKHGPIGGEPWHHWQSQAVLAALGSAETRGYVVEEEGRIIAFCSFSFHRERRMATVGYNGVAPEAQGRGLGDKMMRFILEQMRECGAETAAVVVADNAEHAAARRVYEKHGFETVYNLQYRFRKLRSCRH